MNTTDVLAELRNLLCDSSTFEQGMERIAALVEACEMVERHYYVNGKRANVRLETLDAMLAALKAIGHG